MDYSYLAIAMLVLGLVLLVAELFIPSGGMIGIAMLICMAVSVWSAHRAWWGSSPWQFWGFIAAIVVLVPASLGGAVYLMPRTRLGREVLVMPPTLEEVTGSTEHERRLRQLIGKTGRTLNLLTPGGIVLIDGERLHAESEGMLIDPDHTVHVVAVRGNRLVVREGAGAAGATAIDLKSDLARKPPHEGEFPVPGLPAQEPPLDFEVPQG